MGGKRPKLNRVSATQMISLLPFEFTQKMSKNGATSFSDTCCTTVAIQEKGHSTSVTSGRYDRRCASTPAAQYRTPRARVPTEMYLCRADARPCDAVHYGVGEKGSTGWPV